MLLPGPGRADEGLARLMGALAGTHHLQAQFREERQSGILAFPLVTEGRFEYRAPDYIAREVLQPKPMRFEIDGERMRITRDGQTRIVEAGDQPALGGLLSAIRAILGGDLPRLRSLFSAELNEHPPLWELQLRPRDAGLAQFIEQLTITGRDDLITVIRVDEPNGDWTRTEYRNQELR